MLDLHTAPEKDGIGGYTEIMPPYLVRDEVMFGTAQLPKFADDQFLATRTIDAPRDDASIALKYASEARSGRAYRCAERSSLDERWWIAR